METVFLCRQSVPQSACHSVNHCHSQFEFVWGNEWMWKVWIWKYANSVWYQQFIAALLPKNDPNVLRNTWQNHGAPSIGKQFLLDPTVMSSEAHILLSFLLMSWRSEVLKWESRNVCVCVYTVNKPVDGAYFRQSLQCPTITDTILAHISERPKLDGLPTLENWRHILFVNLGICTVCVSQTIHIGIPALGVFIWFAERFTNLQWSLLTFQWHLQLFMNINYDIISKGCRRNFDMVYGSHKLVYCSWECHTKCGGHLFHVISSQGRGYSSIFPIQGCAAG